MNLPQEWVRAVYDRLDQELTYLIRQYSARRPTSKAAQRESVREAMRLLRELGTCVFDDVVQVDLDDVVWDDEDRVVLTSDVTYDVAAKGGAS